MGAAQQPSWAGERIVRLETRADGHDRELAAVRDLITKMAEAQAEHNASIVKEVQSTNVEVAGLREVATGTRSDLRSLRRVMVGGISAIVVAILIQHLVGA